MRKYYISYMKWLREDEMVGFRMFLEESVGIMTHFDRLFDKVYNN